MGAAPARACKKGGAKVSQSMKTLKLGNLHAWLANRVKIQGIFIYHMSKARDLLK